MTVSVPCAVACPQRRPAGSWRASLPAGGVRAQARCSGQPLGEAVCTGRWAVCTALRATTDCPALSHAPLTWCDVRLRGALCKAVLIGGLQGPSGTICGGSFLIERRGFSRWTSTGQGSSRRGSTRKQPVLDLEIVPVPVAEFGKH